MIETRTISLRNPNAVSQLQSDNGLPPDVQAFCQQQECFNAVREVLSIVTECFGAATVRLSLQTDPETHEDWIEVAVDGIGSVQQLMDAEHRFTLRLRDEVPVRARNLVRLYLTSAED